MSPRNHPFPSRRSLRLQGYDYRQSGAYFVTVCAFRKACLFGRIADAEMTVNNLGSIVAACWQAIAKVRPNVELDAFVVMPNHLHGILFVFDTDRAEKGNQRALTTRNSESSLASSTLGIIIGQFKRAVTIRSKLLAQPPSQPIWQRSYYEHIIRNESSLDDIRKYIVENPARWDDDYLYVE